MPRPSDRLKMQAVRRSPNRSFIARYEGACAACFELILPGDRVRYSPDGLLVHHQHDRSEETKPEVICGRCWLVQPCDCD